VFALALRAAALAALTACAPKPASAPPPEPGARGAAARAPDLERGARLFDDWARELHSDFVPDDPHTPAADGRGGPFGDGRLASAEGAPLPNDGHDYRVVRLLGADLRGAHGALARCEHHGVLVPSLLADTDDAARWHARLRDGEDGIPALGSVLDTQALDDLVAFLLAVRAGVLPSPADLFRPSQHEPCGYEPVPGDAAAGRALHTQHCARCHGDDGRAIPLGPTSSSLGGFVRTRAPLAWYVMLGGKAGTSMPGFLPVLHAGALRDLLTAYAEPARFPDLAP
jgi:mono/diheme cytochrome c family protein